MAGVINGQSVSAEVTNPAFIIKNDDDTMPNKLSFTRAGSGASIDDIQQAVNNIYAATGVSEANSGTDYNAPAGTIINGEDYQTSLYRLATKFAPTAGAGGHRHTGADGDAPGLIRTSIQYTDILPTSVLFVDQYQYPAGAPTDIAWDFVNKLLGVRIDSPESVLHANGDLALTVSDVACPSDELALPTTERTSHYLTGSGSTIRGIADGLNGKLLYMFNGMASDAIITNEDLSASALDRIVTPGASDITLPPNQGLILQYQPTIGRWGTFGGTGSGGSGFTPIEPLVTTYLTPGSGTHNFTGTPISVRARLVGPGGGGGGGVVFGGSGQTDGSPGSVATSFGTSLLVANPGAGGGYINNGGGTGGSASLGTGPVGIAVTGGGSQYGIGTNANSGSAGGVGGNSAFGGAGISGTSISAAGNAAPNTGAGGGGGGADANGTASYGANGGGAGGFVDAIIEGATLAALAGSAAYVVGAGGAGGSAGTNGYAGGNGADGMIEITEYYQ